MTILEKITRIFFPPKCMCCDELVDVDKDYPHICQKCKKIIKISPLRVCSVCKKPMDINAYIPHCKYCAGENVRFEYIISPLIYDDVCSEIIKKYKFGQRTEIANSLGRMLWDRIKEYNLETKFDIIIPAPSGKTNGINLRTEHTKDLCKVVSKLSGIPYKELLFKKEGTVSQNKLSAKLRKTNLKDKIIYKGGKYDKVLLIDDVYTTGATIDESAKMLKKAGCKKIYAGIITVNINEEFK